MGGYLTNITVTNNRFLTGDNELKYYEAYEGQGAGECNNCVVITTISSNTIASEWSSRLTGADCEPTLMYIQYNSFHNLLNPHQQDFDISMANGCAMALTPRGRLIALITWTTTLRCRHSRRGLR